MIEHRPPRIYVLAGTNGAGKSSIGGAVFGTFYFNPDDAAQRFLEADPSLSLAEASSHAWYEGKRLLERSIAERLDFAFETTLGGTTITRLLHDAVGAGMEVRVWYVGLESPKLHIARVKDRVARGGHDIPESKIRERYDRSRENLITLLGSLTELRVFDNSESADPHTGKGPRPRLVLHMERGRIVGPNDLSQTPQWAKPIIAAAVRSDRANASRGA